MFCISQNSKCQDLPKFQFSGGGGCSVVAKTQSAKICLHFNFRRGALHTNIPEKLKWGHSRNFEHKFCHAILWKPLHHR